MLADEDEEARNACVNIVNRNPSQGLPQSGLCIKIKSKKKTVEKFKKIQIKSILSVYGIKKDPKSGKEQIYLLKELVKANSQQNFLRDYLVFELD